MGSKRLSGNILCFVENDDGACDVVQLAAARGAVGKEGFKELHGGGHDNRRVPVFRGKAQFVFGGLILQFAVVERCCGVPTRLVRPIRQRLCGIRRHFCSMILVNGMT